MASMIFFALAILGGLTMAVLHFQRKKIPLALGLGHGSLAVTGLVLLLLVVFNQGTAGMLFVAAGTFGVAALGGLGLISFALRDLRLPTPLLFLHALLALLGFFLLLSVVLTQP
ncbi:MAG TPA: hypothetical protein VIA07_00570 [Desulfuromonadales bacterium]